MMMILVIAKHYKIHLRRNFLPIVIPYQKQMLGARKRANYVPVILWAKVTPLLNFQHYTLTDFYNFCVYQFGLKLSPHQKPVLASWKTLKTVSVVICLGYPAQKALYIRDVGKRGWKTK